MRTFLLMLVLAGLLFCAACTDQGSPSLPVTPPPITTVPATPAVPETTGPGEIPATVTHPHPPPTWNPDGTISAGEYDGEVTLADGRMSVHWMHDGTMLSMGISGQTPGWVAIGFEPTTAMRDADMVLGYVSGGQLTVLDQYSTGNFGPHISDTDLGGTYDVLASGGSESGGFTVIEFSRNLDTGDRFDKVLSPGTTVRFIWSMATSDNPGTQHNIARGSGQLVL